MSTLNEFISSVKTQGMMHTSRFDVELVLPKVLTGNNAYVGDLKKILLHCESAMLPGMSLSTSQSRTYGELREIPWERLYENVNLTFYVDNTMHVKQLFDSWINNCVQNKTTRTMNYYADYVSNMTVSLFDKKGGKRYSTTLYECYPKSVGSIQLDQASRDIMKLQVSMNYKYWDSTLATASNESAAIPKSYFSNFPGYQSNYNSFENSRNSLFSSPESKSVSVGKGSI